MMWAPMLRWTTILGQYQLYAFTSLSPSQYEKQHQQHISSISSSSGSSASSTTAKASRRQVEAANILFYVDILRMSSGSDNIHCLLICRSIYLFLLICMFTERFVLFVRCVAFSCWMDCHCVDRQHDGSHWLFYRVYHTVVCRRSVFDTVAECDCRFARRTHRLEDAAACAVVETTVLWHSGGAARSDRLLLLSAHSIL